MHQLSPLHPNLSMTKDYSILSPDIAKFSNWSLLLIHHLHDIQNPSLASSEPFCDGTWESVPREPFSGSQWLWRESKFLNVDSKALYCMAPDFHQSFNFPIILRDTVCNPDLYKVPTLHQAINSQIPMPVVMPFPLPGMPHPFPFAPLFCLTCSYSSFDLLKLLDWIESSHNNICPPHGQKPVLLPFYSSSTWLSRYTANYVPQHACKS